jgi:hypothetical protein
VNRGVVVKVVGFVSAVVAFAAYTMPASAEAAAGLRPDVQGQITQVLRQHPTAVRTGFDQVSFQDGHVTLTVGPRASGIGACHSGSSWYCFYQNANFNQGFLNDGRVLNFNVCDGKPGNFNNFGFDKQASGWVNNRGDRVKVYRGPNGGGGLLWTESAHTVVSYVGDANNDQASSFNCPF